VPCANDILTGFKLTDVYEQKSVLPTPLSILSPFYRLFLWSCHCCTTRQHAKNKLSSVSRIRLKRAAAKARNHVELFMEQCHQEFIEKSLLSEEGQEIQERMTRHEHELVGISQQAQENRSSLLRLHNALASLSEFLQKANVGGTTGAVLVLDTEERWVGASAAR